MVHCSLPRLHLNDRMRRKAGLDPDPDPEGGVHWPAEDEDDEFSAVSSSDDDAVDTASEEEEEEAEEQQAAFEQEDEGPATAEHAALTAGAEETDMEGSDFGSEMDVADRGRTPPASSPRLVTQQQQQTPKARTAAGSALTGGKTADPNQEVSTFSACRIL